MPRVHEKPRITYLPNRNRPHRVTYYDLGKRRTKHFSSKSAAAAFADEHVRETRDQGPLALSPEERILLRQVRAAGEEKGLQLFELLQSLLEEIRRRPLADSGLTLADAIEEFLTDCLARNLRLHTRQHYERMLGYFAEGREGLSPAAIDGDMIADWIVSRYSKAESQKTCRTPLAKFMRWCQEKGYRSDAPAIRLHLPKTDEHRVQFLPVPEVEAFLYNLKPPYWAACALGLFTGIRPMELQRLDWSMINFAARTITIPGAVAKTRQFRRLHNLPDNLWAWLEAAPTKEGPIVPANYRNYRHAVRTARGGASWPNDAMRHSFGSYGYHRGLEWCIDTMGHISGYKTFVKHYKGAASQAESEQYFAIMPPAPNEAEEETPAP